MQRRVHERFSLKVISVGFSGNHSCICDMYFVFVYRKVLGDFYCLTGEMGKYGIRCYVYRTNGVSRDYMIKRQRLVRELKNLFVFWF